MDTKKTYENLRSNWDKNTKLSDEAVALVKEITALFNERGETMTSIQLYNITGSLLKVASNLIDMNRSLRGELALALAMAGLPPTPPTESEVSE